MINNHEIKLIEKKYGFKLYEWQKEYLLNNGPVISGRRNGKTFVYMIKLLTINYEPLDVRYNNDIADSPTQRYRNWFIVHLREMHYNLVEAGVNCRPLIVC